MLKNIDPLLSPDLLSTLRAMGHGDELAIVDANYPAASSGRPVIRADGSQVPAVAAAVPPVRPRCSRVAFSRTFQIKPS